MGSRAAASQLAQSTSSASQSNQSSAGTCQLPFGAPQFQHGASQVLRFERVQVECLAGGMQAGPMIPMNSAPMMAMGAPMMGMNPSMMGFHPSMMGPYAYGRSGN